MHSSWLLPPGIGTGLVRLSARRQNSNAQRALVHVKVFSGHTQRLFRTGQHFDTQVFVVMHVARLILVRMIIGGGFEVDFTTDFLKM